MTAVLVKPGLDHLPAYQAALERGWSADTVRGRVAAVEELAWIDKDPAGFLAALEDPEAKGPPIDIGGGRTVPRLPGVRRWIWDDDFCGSVGLRWQAGTPALPPTVLGHVGYTVPAWKQGRGYATAGLALILPLARSIGLPYVELTTQEANAASVRVILKNGGYLVERFAETLRHGGAEALRFRIDL